ncbi:LysR family transcriptional regulator [Pandoraea apista]|uniref:LysR family transcriptional regulator n=2 Tax=Pandoraea apista TaxID=93218 RepID=A0ABX9ZRW2_9BURK|nr:LysR family transcriptional regulator [Pandoraea apista]RRJ34499.1 LysR family transcriptional regulator [Pandoraea apista]RRJ80693.1 LysR family transcriptional regulator [Pandoraea apista]RSD14446.1 LysR family transcriptional regulator [Pandoraea apista]RSD20589.1 LysR family transcriptional regulator [Pandoraea apista]
MPDPRAASAVYRDSAPMLQSSGAHLDDLLLFTHVVDAGGFSAAERQTGIAKSRLSRRVATLERALGVRLLHRSGQVFGLTPVGEAVLAHAREVAAHVDKIGALTRSAVAEPSGVIHLHTSVLIAETTLPPILAEFACAHPGVQVQLTLSNRFVDLAEERLDLVIRAAVAPLASEDVIALPMATSASIVVAHPSLLQADGPPVRLDALSGYPCLAQGTLAKPRPWQFVDADGKPIDIAVTPAIAVDNLLVIRELALRGAGVAQLPAYLCQDAIDDGSLVPVLQTVRSRPATLYAMYPSRRGMTSAVRVFLDLVRARWQADPVTA